MKIKLILITLLFTIFLYQCDAKNDTKISYGFDIQPIFNNNCLMCHGDESFSNANLVLTSYEKLMEGNSTNGPVIIPKYPENSILIDKISNTTPSFGSQMPINMDPLSYDDIAIIERWIYYGAKDN